MKNKSLKILNPLFEKSLEMMCNVDESGTIIEYNSSFLRQLCYSENEIHGMNIFDFIAPSFVESAKNAFESLCENKFYLDWEGYLKRKDGKLIPILSNAFQMNNLFFLSMRDVSKIHVNRSKKEFTLHKNRKNQQKIIDEKLNQFEEKTDFEKIKVVEQLGTRIAHDIRNPLAVIQTSVENLFFILDEKHQKLFESKKQKILNSIFRISHQIENVLDYSRSRRVHKKLISLSTILEHVKSSLMIPENIKIILPQKNIILMVDEVLLEIVFHNLLYNAIQAIHHIGLVTIYFSEDKKNIKIYVKDSGIGIKKENIKNIFTPFFTTKQHGTGIGLSTVRSIIESHDGVISVTSLPTIFEIILPKNSTALNLFIKNEQHVI